MLKARGVGVSPSRFTPSFEITLDLQGKIASADGLLIPKENEKKESENKSKESENENKESSTKIMRPATSLLKTYLLGLTIKAMTLI